MASMFPCHRSEMRVTLKVERKFSVQTMALCLGGKSAYRPWVSHLKQEKGGLGIYVLWSDGHWHLFSPIQISLKSLIELLTKI